ncbi:PREDICTED: probable tRNA (uracil-O(2)-)-methyltransferase [Elephantulus edwardii]|uniref:probable tRNA (uracil-O(2)-)-methyltransferase n=1 Tax=Elephantulus edwardii TaxID=28737 RepID=UPI0003F08785|nr:PREDICTED: probable tRNA (uracil-O(2)-)-methyltransferase [Elephantulus edwardii]
MAEVGRLPVPCPGSRLPAGFWAAVTVWLERPQVANKRLCGARLEARRRAVLPRAEARRPRPSAGHDPGPENGRVSAQGRPSPGPPGSPEPLCPSSALGAVWEDLARSLDLLAFLARSEAGPPEAVRPVDVVLRSVIPKASPRCPLPAPTREVVVQDVHTGTVTFLPLEEDADGSLKIKLSNIYQLQLSHGQQEWFISVLIFCPERWYSDGAVYPTPMWLGKQLLAKLARWSVEDKRGEFKSTLSLIPIAKYSRVYQELKEKYKAMVKVWPEVTDPEKFVYEDVAIASYLLILWEEERAERGLTEKQSFVDLGCGNGLLTHILCSAGHPGRGIDVRRRKIWDMFGPGTRLEEGAVTPGDKHLFPDVDWLIGNHSDELTPWIPVIAARSSYHCRFFVLPCCCFSFVGKYPRRQSQKTQYREYLDFVTDVGLACGFLVDEDCLRIPSTKRVCLVGRSRTYPAAEEASVDAQRTVYIQSQGGPRRQPCSGPLQPPPEAQEVGTEAQPPAPGASPCRLWVPGFRPREKVERVRNCASVPRDLVDRVVLQVAQRLLSTGEPHANGGGTPWNPGGSLSLTEIAGELDQETLQQLKRECGGLQTLLRNHHQVFSVGNGQVRLRDWREEQPLSSPDARTFKTRLCWFFMHHPDGCALPAPRCPFAHGPEELRPGRSERRARPVPPEAAVSMEA